MGVEPVQIEPTDCDEPPDYPVLFRALLVRSVQAALADVDPAAPRLDEDQRERSLYALSLALDLAEAWPAARELTLTIAPFMEMQGYRREWMDFLEKGIAQAASQADKRTYARLQLHMGRLYQLLGDYALADKCLLRSRQLAEESGDKTALVATLDRLSIAAVEQNDFTKARALAEETLTMLEPDDPAGAPSYHVLGLIARRQAKPDEAIAHYTHALALRRQEGVVRFVAQAVRDVGFAYRYAKEYDTALLHYRQAVQLFNESGSIFEEAGAMMGVGIISWHLGRYDDALTCYAACEPVFIKTSSDLYLAKLHNNRGLVFLDLGRYGESEQAFALSIGMARALGDHLETANAQESLGGLYLRMHRYDDAIATWQAALHELATLPETPRYMSELLHSRLREAEQQRGTPAPASPVAR